MLSITKIVRFEAAHVISSYRGPCSNIHGHSYELHITLSGNMLNKSDILMDFAELKKLLTKTVLQDFDHALLLKRNNINLAASNNVATKIYWLDHEPSAEFLVGYIAHKLEPLIPEHVKLKRVRLVETDSCYAEWETDEVA